MSATRLPWGSVGVATPPGRAVLPPVPRPPTSRVVPREVPRFGVSVVLGLAVLAPLCVGPPPCPDRRDPAAIGVTSSVSASPTASARPRDETPEPMASGRSAGRPPEAAARAGGGRPRSVRRGQEGWNASLASRSASPARDVRTLVPVVVGIAVLRAPTILRLAVADGSAIGRGTRASVRATAPSKARTLAVSAALPADRRAISPIACVAPFHASHDVTRAVAPARAVSRYVGWSASRSFCGANASAPAAISCSRSRT